MTATATTRKLAGALVCAAIAGAPFASAAGATTTDGQSPTGDAVVGSAAPVRQDLRSPDTRDAAERYRPAPAQDLRSPDTRDAATGYAPVLEPQASLAAAPASAPSAVGGFDWTSAAIGAAAGLGLLLVLVALRSVRGRVLPT